MQKLNARKGVITLAVLLSAAMFIGIIFLVMVRKPVKADAVSVGDSFVAINDVYASAPEVESSELTTSEIDNEDIAATPSEAPEIESELKAVRAMAIAESEDAESGATSNPVTTVAFEMLKYDFDKLKAGDIDTVKKYFGETADFIPDNVADRVSASTIEPIELKGVYTTSSLIVHVCTIDYDKLNSDYAEAEKESTETAKKSIAEGLADGKYDVCYNITLEINQETNEPVINALYKQAITGGWYKGVGEKLEPVSHDTTPESTESEAESTDDTVESDQSEQDGE